MRPYGKTFQNHRILSIECIHIHGWIIVRCENHTLIVKQPAIIHGFIYVFTLTSTFNLWKPTVCPQRFVGFRANDDSQKHDLIPLNWTTEYESNSPNEFHVNVAWNERERKNELEIEFIRFSARDNIEITSWLHFVAPLRN